MDRDPEKEMENAQELEQAMKEARMNELCEDCRFAEWDYNESGSWIEDCKKGLRPEWYNDQDTAECYGFMEVARDDGTEEDY